MGGVRGSRSFLKSVTISRETSVSKMGQVTVLSMTGGVSEDKDQGPFWRQSMKVKTKVAGAETIVRLDLLVGAWEVWLGCGKAETA